MGNLIMWEESPSDSTWTKTEVYRSDTQNGTYSKITTLEISDFTYYDSTGISSQYYKIRFTNDDASQVTDYSTEMQGKTRFLYTDPKKVLRIAGINLTQLPPTIDNNTLYDWIYDISKNIEQLMKSVYGRIETFEEIQSTKYLNLKQNIILNHKNVSDVSVYLREGIAPDSSGNYTWNQRNEGYDFQVFPEGKIKLFTFPVVQEPYNYRDIKIVGSYGQTDIPNDIEQFAMCMAAIRIFINITGGSYNDVTAWSLGEYNESLGEPYTNLRASIDMILKEIERVKERTGISEKLFNVRYA